MAYPSRSTRRRRPLLVALAALAIVSVNVFAGSLSAQAVPSQPVIDPTGGGTDTPGNFLVTGTITSADDGWVSVEVTNSAGTNTYCVTGGFDYNAGVNQPWACLVPIEYGFNQFIATGRDDTDNSGFYMNGDPGPASDPVTLTLGGTQSPVITSPPPNASIASQNITFVGTGPTDGAMTVMRVPPFNDLLCPISGIDTAGDWSCNATNVPYGEYDIFFRSVTAGGTNEDSAAQTIDVQPNKPSTIVSVGSGTLSAQVTASSDPTSDAAAYWIRYPGAVNEGICPASWPFDYNVPPTAGPVVTCASTSTQAGVHLLSSNDFVANTYSSQRGELVRVPQIPVISTATRNANGTVTFVGTVPSDAASPFPTVDDGSEVTAELTSGTDICTGFTVGTAWTCTGLVPDPAQSARAYATSIGYADDTGVPGSLDAYIDGVSNLSAVIPVAAIPPIVKPLVPAPIVYDWSFTIVGNGIYRPGDPITFLGVGAPPGAVVVAEMHSTPVVLGQAVTDPAGGFLITSTIPADAEPGDHEFVVTMTGTDGSTTTRRSPVAIEPAPVVPVITPTPIPLPTEPADGGDDGTSGAGGGANSERDEPDAPSVLTAGVVTFAQLLANPIAIAAAGGLALGILFLVAVPGELLTATLSANTGRLGRGFARIESTIDRVQAWFIRVTRTRALAAAILIAIVSVIFGFSDPGFGFDLVSLRLVLSLAIAFFLLYYGVSWAVGQIVNRRWGAETLIAIQPAIILFAAVGVVLSRVVGFAPGIFIGVVIGLELVRASRRAELGAALLQFFGIFAVGIAAWLAMSAILSAGPPTDFGGALVVDTLAAITLEGLTGAMIAILPLTFLEGSLLFKESKVLWLVAFLLIAISFALLVLPTAITTTTPDSIAGWYLALLAFGALAFGAWGFFVWRGRHDTTQSTAHVHRTDGD